jgi:hypothetical protein
MRSIGRPLRDYRPLCAKSLSINFNSLRLETRFGLISPVENLFMTGGINQFTAFDHTGLSNRMGEFRAI